MSENLKELPVKSVTFVIVKSVNFKVHQLLEKLRALTFESVNAFKTGLKVNKLIKIYLVNYLVNALTSRAPTYVIF